MTSYNPSATGHDHFFLGSDHQRNERKVWLVIALTASMMLVEIVAGTLYGSMALVVAAEKEVIVAGGRRVVGRHQGVPGIWRKRPERARVYFM